MVAKAVNQPVSECADAARAMKAAGEQIDLAIEESHPAVAQLGDAMQHLCACLASLPSGAAGDQVKAVRAELARAITCLQFHDRMTQHLAHVRNYLLDSAGRNGQADGVVVPAWEHLHGSGRADPAQGGSDIELF